MVNVQQKVASMGKEPKRAQFIAEGETITDAHHVYREEKMKV